MDKAAYDARVERVSAALGALGVDLTTCGEAIDHFRTIPGIDPNFGEDERFEFHELMHAKLDCWDGSRESEKAVVIQEIALMRGFVSDHNPHDIPDFGKPVAYPHIEFVCIWTRNRMSLVEEERGKKNYTAPMPKPEALQEQYQQAIRDDVFFRRMTGGRALYQLCTDEMRALPLAFLGVYKAPGPGFRTAPIDESWRKRIIKAVGDITPELSQRGATAIPSPPPIRP